MTLLQFYRLMRKRRILFACVLFGMVGCGECYTSKLTPLYIASAGLEMRRAPLNEIRVFENPVGDAIEETIFRRIESVDPEVVKLAAADAEWSGERPDRIRSIESEILSRVTVSVDNQSKEITVSARMPDPKLAARYATAYARAAAKYSVEKRRELVDAWRTYLDTRIATAVETKGELEKSREYLEHYMAIEPPRLTVAPAYEPSIQIYPNPTTNRFVCITIGFLLGLAAVLAVESVAREREEERLKAG